MSSSLNIDDFIAGMLSVMKLNQVETLPIAIFHEKAAMSFRILEEISEMKGIELRFHCGTRKLNAQSHTLHYALMRAEQAGVMKRDGQRLTITLLDSECADIINRSPVFFSEWELIVEDLYEETRYLTTSAIQ